MLLACTRNTEPKLKDKVYDYPFDTWSKVQHYMDMLYEIQNSEVAILEECNFKDGRKSISLKDRNHKIIYQLKTLKDGEPFTEAKGEFPAYIT